MVNIGPFGVAFRVSILFSVGLKRASPARIRIVGLTSIHAVISAQSTWKFSVEKVMFYPKARTPVNFSLQFSLNSPSARWELRPQALFWVLAKFGDKRDLMIG
ncbi:hypothetical protein J6590_051298 [Homalodisca vitripennis]|nr:hypothetical protein J6590_051298 [Homalodisca vitripennis]